MSKFKVGDICEIVWAEGIFKSLCGRECTILSVRPPKGQDFARRAGALEWYEIEIQGEPPDDPWFASDRALKLKKPPQELGSWGEIQRLTKWSPEKQTA